MYIFLLYVFDIVKKFRFESRFDSVTNSKIQEQVSYYVYEYSDFSRSQTNVAFRLMHGLTRDVVCLFVIVIMNFFILLTIKKSIKKKSKLSGRGTTETVNSELVASNTIANSSTGVIRTRAVEIGGKARASAAQNANDAERNAKIMIVVSGMNYFLGHVYMFIAHCILIEPSVFRTCFFNIQLV